MSQSNRVSVRYVEETTFGTTPSTPTMIELLRTDGGLEGKIDTAESKSARADRMIQGLFQVGRNGAGNFKHELAFGQFDDLIRAAVCATAWSGAIALSLTNISFAASDKSINRAAGDFLAAGVVAGMWLLVGGSVVGSGVNNGLVQALTVSATKITTGKTFTDESAGPTITIKNGGMVRNGTAETSFTFEQAHLDTDSYLRTKGSRISKLDLTIAAKALVDISFDLVAKDFEDGNVSAASVVTPPNSNLVFNSAADVLALAEGGAVLDETITALSLSIDNNVDMVSGVGSLAPRVVPYRTQKITGKLDVYNSTSAWTGILQKFTNFTPSSVSITMANGSPLGYYIFTFPAYRYSGRQMPAGGLDVNTIASLPFTGYRGANAYQVQVDRISA